MKASLVFVLMMLTASAHATVDSNSQGFVPPSDRTVVCGGAYKGDPITLPFRFRSVNEVAYEGDAYNSGGAFGRGRRGAWIKQNFVLQDGVLTSVSRLIIAYSNAIGPIHENLDLKIRIRKSDSGLIAEILEKGWMTKEYVSGVLHCGIQ